MNVVVTPLGVRQKVTLTNLTLPGGHSAGRTNVTVYLTAEEQAQLATALALATPPRRPGPSETKEALGA